MDLLNKMWMELAKYQPIADRNGHGESWRKMCQERTQGAIEIAADEAGCVTGDDIPDEVVDDTNPDAAKYAAYYAAASAADVASAFDASVVIRYIKQALK